MATYRQQAIALLQEAGPLTGFQIRQQLGCQDRDHTMIYAALRTAVRRGEAHFVLVKGWMFGRFRKGWVDGEYGPVSKLFHYGSANDCPHCHASEGGC